MGRFCPPHALAPAGAGALGPGRRIGFVGARAAWRLWEALSHEAELPLFAGLDVPGAAATEELPDLAPVDEVRADYQTLGLSLRAHPFTFLRPS